MVVRRANYRNGMLEGETRDYAADGSLAQSAPYQRDLLHGTVRRFAPDGQISAERRYANGKPLGAWQSLLASAPPADEKGAPRVTMQYVFSMTSRMVTIALGCALLFLLGFEIGARFVGPASSPVLATPSSAHASPAAASAGLSALDGAPERPAAASDSSTY
ncbi:toxin-antitoxin system YwqK family antitoxin [Paraburkholderia sp. DGU8]|jgi:hypothetical protein|uniref:toxin-antitoxin system YwqK family antitoxin n=1 Tax=Paraburkholderia sp. DGU8 TaxID=3161997 RepID=UPI003466A5F7